MPEYSYRAVDRHGKEIQGEQEAVSEAVLVDKLRTAGFFPVRIKRMKGPGLGSMALEDLPGLNLLFRILSRGKASRKSLKNMTRQLKTLLASGIPLRRSIHMLETQTDDRNLRRALGEIGADIESGASFSEALSRHPRIFPRVYVNMVRAGEISGALDEVLDRLSIFAEKANSIRLRVRSALVYPACVIVLASLLVTGILVFIVPKFSEIYAGFGQDLPFMTQMLMTASELLVHRAPALLGIGALIAVFLWRFGKTESGRYLYDAFFLKIPVFGALIQKAAVAKFARTFSTLIQTGVPILQSLIIVRDVVGNELMGRDIVRIHNSVRDGEPIARSIARSKTFPVMVSQMMAVAEESGTIDSLLVKIAESYEEDVDATVDGLTSLLEPFILVFLGVVIGFIVIAMYMPIFDIPKLMGKR